jgi:hypothetical protein
MFNCVNSIVKNYSARWVIGKSARDDCALWRKLRKTLDMGGAGRTKTFSSLSINGGLRAAAFTCGLMTVCSRTRCIAPQPYAIQDESYT